MNSNLAITESAGPTLEEAVTALVQSEEENARLRKAMVDKTVAETMLTEMSVANGSLNLQLEGGACQLLAQCFADQFRDSGAENYLEMSFRTKDGMDLLATLQRVTGKTPGRLRAEAEDRVRTVENLARIALQAWSSTSGDLPAAMMGIASYFAEKDGTPA